MCDCVCDTDGGEPDVFSAVTRKARKAYICCECREPILPGQRYEYVTGLWEGRWKTFRTCQPCAAIRKDRCPCAPFGLLGDMVRDWSNIGLTEIPTDDE